MTVLEYKNFYAYYKQGRDLYTALEDISLEIFEGEFLVVVGASGSGKTTLLKSILGSMYHTEGELLLDGDDIEKIKKGKRNLAYICQECNLFPNLTVFDNIAFPLNVMHTSFEETRRRVEEVATQFDINMLLTRKPRHLSGGQLQRVELARAIVKNPRIILFDEPFAGLDPMLKTSLRLFIKETHKRYGQTYIFVTHDLTEAYMLADRIAVLENGNLIEVGTPQEIKENPKSDLMKGFFGL